MSSVTRSTINSSNAPGFAVGHVCVFNQNVHMEGCGTSVYSVYKGQPSIVKEIYDNEIIVEVTPQNHDVPLLIRCQVNSY